MKIGLRKAAILIILAGGLLGLAFSSLVMYEVFGSGGVLVGILIFPYTLFYIPWYVLVVHDSWNLLLLNYGSLGVGWSLLSIADRRKTLPRSAIDEPSTQPVVTAGYTIFKVVLLLAGGLLLAAIAYRVSGS